MRQLKFLASLLALLLVVSSAPSLTHAAALLDRVKMTSATTGTGASLTLGSPIAPYQSAAAAGAVDQYTYSFLVEDTGNAWEIDTGLYTASGTTLTRVLSSSSTGSLLNLSGSETVSIIVRSVDVPTVIGEIVTSGSQASVTFSNIPATGRDLQVVISGRGDTAATTATCQLQLNGDTGANYDIQWLEGTPTAGGGNAFAQSVIGWGRLAAATGTANDAGFCQATVLDYRRTTFFKIIEAITSAFWGTSGSTSITGKYAGQWRSTSAVTSLKVFLSAGNFVNGDVVTLRVIP